MKRTRGKIGCALAIGLQVGHPVRHIHHPWWRIEAGERLTLQRREIDLELPSDLHRARCDIGKRLPINLILPKDGSCEKTEK